MANPFFKGAAGNASPLGGLLGLLSAAGNPQAAIQHLAASSPQGKEAMRAAQAMAQGKSDGELQAIAAQLAKQQGIDINQVRRLAAQFGIKA